jgi:taurine dioxygenase
MTLAIQPMDSPLGAEIRGVDLSEPVDDETFAEILKAWHEYLVLCFPGQNLDEDAQAAFCQRFGELFRRKATRGPRNPYAMIISNVKEDGQWIGAIPIGELLFHSDAAFNPRPNKATMLYALEVPKHGGETLFANMYKVYEALDQETRDLLENCTADNHFVHDGYTEFDGREQHAVHPVVATHPATGRRLLFVNRLMTRQVMELEPGVYQPILDRIFDLVDSGEFTYVHHWTPGDLLLWDNRCTQHARKNFDPEERRVMRRFSVVGEEGGPQHEIAEDRRVLV